MQALEIVTVIVSVGGFPLALSPAFSLRRGFRDAGRQGAMWIEHADERTIAERPLEDAVDPPLPHRPLRSRFL